MSGLNASPPPLRVLVTGATSQLGHALLPVLRAEGHRVVALSRRAVQATQPGGEVEWHQADLENGWLDVGPLDVVISFGPLQALADTLSKLARAPCSRLVATSSMSAESKRESVVEEDRALSAHLRSAETALIAQCERLGIGWTVLRPTMIYGLGRDQNLTPIARRALRLRVFPYPRGRGLRQPVHAVDVAQAAWHAVDCEAARGRIFSLGGGERLPIGAMFQRVHAALPAPTLTLPLPRTLLHLLAMLRPSLRGAVSRIDEDLVADNGEIERVLKLHPRGFAPDPSSFGLEPRA